MNMKSGWNEVNGIAAANNVSYSTFVRRRHEGMSPIEAASKPPLVRIAKEKPKKAPSLVRRVAERPQEPEVLIGRQAALEKIDKVVNKHCKSCLYGNMLVSQCLLECPIGKQLQELGMHLKRERKSRSGRVEGAIKA